jgi:uncharacterized protein (TIGR03067 family)
MLFSVAFVSVLFLTTAVSPGEPQTDKEKLQGTWVLTSTVADGDDFSAERIKDGYQAVIQGDKFTTKSRTEEPRTAVVRFDPTSRPKGFDTITSLGIYELNGDELKICFGGSKRPTEFSSKAGSKTLLLTFKRAKP